ncbi:MAG: hypothetical protein HC836_49770 [Richelia sp. RM2_1_2]|nr:hypothetical protein [Richelia sp. RM2_1_2]
MYHVWGKWPDELFIQVNNAASFIGDYCRKYGRISVTQTKEKYGTARVYCSFGWYSLHDITHPGYVYSQYPKWLWKLNCTVLSKLIRPFNWLIVKYQTFIYRRAYNLAFKRFPLVKDEIVAGADYSELLGEYFKFVNLCHDHSASLRKSCTLTNPEKCDACLIKLPVVPYKEANEE